jgi:hypothetical protein
MAWNFSPPALWWSSVSGSIPETIIKLYNEGIAPEVAEQEKQFARAAFIAGVPTALSYDVVTCGSRTGVVYEMLDARLFSALIRATPDRIGEHGALLAQIAPHIPLQAGGSFDLSRPEGPPAR